MAGSSSMTGPIILIYFILMPYGWQFLTISDAPGLDYCQYEAGEIAKAGDTTPGNMMVICAEDRRILI
jgi:hypothetical protein